MIIPVRFRLYVLLSLLFLATGCSSKRDTQIIVQDAIETVRENYIQDSRLAWFDIRPEINGATVLLTGETDQSGAKVALLSLLESQGIAAEDHVTILPDTALGEKRWGIVNISVANLRRDPSHSSELVTQATLGTPAKLLKRNGSFYLVQIPDGYVAWVDDGGIHEVSENQLRELESAERIIFLKRSGAAYQEPNTTSLPVSDLVSGDILEFISQENGFFQVSFPDGRTAYVVESDAERLDTWLADINPTGESLVQTAQGLMGLPYLWGGTSAKGVDCSGFTKSIYFLNGILLPRDADQQSHTGLLVDEGGDFDKLQHGDLLFFGRAATDSSRERVVHVGMWIGDNRFIHSSGRVRISSIDPADPDYDAYNLRRYLRTKRILGEHEGVHLLKNGLTSLL